MSARHLRVVKAVAPAAAFRPARPDPIAYARPELARHRSGAYWVLIVDHCPHCGKRHTHGGGNGPKPEYGHRSSHCADGRLGGYWLQAAP